MDLYDLLGVDVTTDEQSGKVTLTQGLLTKKVMNIVVMLDINKNTTPAAKMQLGIYSDISPFGGPWKYAYVVEILMYISRISGPDIHCSVH